MIKAERLDAAQDMPAGRRNFHRWPDGGRSAFAWVKKITMKISLPLERRSNLSRESQPP
jgi:hypothetical protein